MKMFVRTLILLVVLALPLSMAAAQDEAAPNIPEDAAGFYVITAEGGAFDENDDGTFALTLENVPEYTAAVAQQPTMVAWRAQTLELMGDWAASPDGLEGSAVMEVEGMTLWLTLTNPVYDDSNMTLTFDAVVGDIYAAEESKDGPAAPKSFDLATLFVKIDYDFEAGLFYGGVERGGRDPVPPADQDWPIFT
jgi:hypothetical protein